MRKTTDGSAAVFNAAIAKTFAGQIGFSLIAFIGSLLTARLLGPSGRGDLAILILIPTIFVAVLELGQEYTTSHLAARSPDDRAAIHTIGALYAVALAPVAAVFVGVTLWPLHVIHAGEVPRAALAGGVAVSASIYIRVLSGLTLAMSRVALYNVVRLLLAASFPTAVILIAVSGSRSAVAYYFGWCLGTLAVALVLAAAFRREIARPRRIMTREQFRVGLPIHVANVGQFLLLRADQLLLLVFATNSAVGEYAVAVNIVEVLWYLPAAVGVVSVPFLSASRPMEEKTSALAHATRLCFWLTSVAALLLGLLAIPLVPFVFGEAFQGSVVPLELLLPGVAAAGIVRVCTSGLIAQRETQVLWKAMVWALAVNLALNVVFIPPLGASGAAIASTLAYAFLAVLLLRRMTRSWNITVADCLRLPDRLHPRRLLATP
jgi:O-antigen/teichoic acid export membrane protein